MTKILLSLSAKTQKEADDLKMAEFERDYLEALQLRQKALKPATFKVDKERKKDK